MLMDTLEGNLSEGTQPQAPRKADTVSSQVTLPSSAQTVEVVSTIQPKREESEPKVHDFLKFNFVMKKFLIRLFTAEKTQVRSDSHVCFQHDLASERVLGNVFVRERQEGLGQLFFGGFVHKRQHFE